jgi:hypothetical protein
LSSTNADVYGVNNFCDVKCFGLEQYECPYFCEADNIENEDVCFKMSIFNPIGDFLERTCVWVKNIIEDSGYCVDKSGISCEDIVVEDQCDGEGSITVLGNECFWFLENINENVIKCILKDSINCTDLISYNQCARYEQNGKECSWILKNKENICIYKGESEICEYYLTEKDCKKIYNDEECVWVKSLTGKECISANNSDNCNFYLNKEDCNIDTNGKECSWILKNGENICIDKGESEICEYYLTEKDCEEVFNGDKCGWINENNIFSCINFNSSESCLFYMNKRSCSYDIEDKKCSWINDGTSESCVEKGKASNCNEYLSEDDCEGILDGSNCDWNSFVDKCVNCEELKLKGDCDIHDSVCWWKGNNIDGSCVSFKNEYLCSDLSKLVCSSYFELEKLNILDGPCIYNSLIEDDEVHCISVKSLSTCEDIKSNEKVKGENICENAFNLFDIEGENKVGCKWDNDENECKDMDANDNCVDIYLKVRKCDLLFTSTGSFCFWNFEDSDNNNDNNNNNFCESYTNISKCSEIYTNKEAGLKGGYCDNASNFFNIIYKDECNWNENNKVCEIRKPDSCIYYSYSSGDVDCSTHESLLGKCFYNGNPSSSSAEDEFCSDIKNVRSCGDINYFEICNSANISIFPWLTIMWNISTSDRGCVWFNDKCFSINECESRIAVDNDNEISRRPCGYGCVKDVDGLCKISCWNGDHYTVNDNGECVLDNCENRKANNIFEKICGEGCLMKEGQEGNVCSNSCENSLHFEANDKGICVERGCETRKVDKNAERVCGSGECYGQEDSIENDSCWKTCKDQKY